MKTKIELNKVFTIEKGSRKRRWKVIEHPNFKNAYALVSDHSQLFTTSEHDSSTTKIMRRKKDEKHIVGGSTTLEKIYQQAYDHT